MMVKWSTPMEEWGTDSKWTTPMEEWVSDSRSTTPMEEWVSDSNDRVQVLMDWREDEKIGRDTRKNLKPP